MKKLSSLLFCLSILFSSYNAVAMESHSENEDNQLGAQVLGANILIFLLGSSIAFCPAEIIEHILQYSNAFSRIQYSMTSQSNRRLVLALQNPVGPNSMWTDTLMVNRQWRANVIGDDLQLISQNDLFTISISPSSASNPAIVHEIVKAQTRAENAPKQDPVNGVISCSKKSRSPSPTGSQKSRRNARPERIPMEVSEGGRSLFTDRPIEIHSHGHVFQAFQALLICNENTLEPVMLAHNLEPFAAFSAQKMVEIGERIYLAHYWKNEITVFNAADLEEAVHTIHLDGDIRALFVLGNILAVAHADQISFIDTTQNFEVLHSVSVGRRPERIILIENRVLLVLCLGIDLRMLGASVSIINLEDCPF